MSKQGDKHWTYEQIAYLRVNYSTSQTVTLIECLKKTPEAIRTKASRLGLKKNIEIVQDGFKRCPHCQDIKPISFFFKNQSWCKNCMVQKRQEWGAQKHEYLAAYRHIRVARNPLKMAAIAARGSHKQRAPKDSKDGHNLSEYQWQEILQLHNNTCPICQQPFTDENPPTRDCIVPIFRGGKLTANNVQPLHSGCNKIKYHQTDRTYCTRPMCRGKWG